MYLMENGKLGTPEEKVKELTAERDAALKESNEWKKKFKDLNRELMCELRDPNGTIWEHASSLQNQLDNAVRQLSRTLDQEKIKELLNKKSK